MLMSDSEKSLLIDFTRLLSEPEKTALIQLLKVNAVTHKEGFTILEKNKQYQVLGKNITLSQSILIVDSSEADIESTPKLRYLILDNKDAEDASPLVTSSELHFEDKALTILSTHERIVTFHTVKEPIDSLVFLANLKQKKAALLRLYPADVFINYNRYSHEEADYCTVKPKFSKVMPFSIYFAPEPSPDDLDIISHLMVAYNLITKLQQLHELNILYNNIAYHTIEFSPDTLNIYFIESRNYHLIEDVKKQCVISSLNDVNAFSADEILKITGLDVAKLGFELFYRDDSSPSLSHYVKFDQKKYLDYYDRMLKNSTISNPDFVSKKPSISAAEYKDFIETYNLVNSICSIKSDYFAMAALLTCWLSTVKLAPLVDRLTIYTKMYNKVLSAGLSISTMLDFKKELYGKPINFSYLIDIPSKLKQLGMEAVLSPDYLEKIAAFFESLKKLGAQKFADRPSDLNDILTRLKRVLTPLCNFEYKHHLKPLYQKIENALKCNKMVADDVLKLMNDNTKAMNLYDLISEFNQPLTDTTLVREEFKDFKHRIAEFFPQIVGHSIRIQLLLCNSTLPAKTKASLYEQLKHCLLLDPPETPVAESLQRLSLCFKAQVLAYLKAALVAFADKIADPKKVKLSEQKIGMVRQCLSCYKRIAKPTNAVTLFASSDDKELLAKLENFLNNYLAPVELIPESSELSDTASGSPAP